MTAIFAALATPALLGLLLTASLLVVSNEWRLGYGALGVQYVLAALMLGQIAVWQVIVVQMLVGSLIVTILVLTGRQINFGFRPGAEPGPWPPPGLFEFSTGLPFRVTAAVMAAAVAGYLASQPAFGLPGVPLALKAASFVLIGLGLLNLGLTEEPMNAGFGLLTVLSGFQLSYAAVEPSLAVLALLAAVGFGVALAVSYLAFVRYAAQEQEQGG
jgi:hypothetical protein